MARPIGPLNPQTQIIMNNCRPMVKVHCNGKCTISYSFNAHYSQFSCHVQLHTFFFSNKFRDTQILHYSNIGVLTKFTYFYCNVKYTFLRQRYKQITFTLNHCKGKLQSVLFLNIWYIIKY